MIHVRMLTILCLLGALPAAAQDSPGSAQSPQAGVAELDSLLTAGQHELVAERLRSAMAAELDDAWRAYYSGRVAMGLHEFRAAEGHFNRAVDMEPWNANYRYWAGLAAHERMDASGMLGKAALARRAMSRFREAVERNPSHVDARIWLIQYLWRTPGIIGGSRSEALKQVEELRWLDPAGAHRLLGGMRWEAEDFADAEREYRSVVAVDPTDAQAWYMLGRTRQHQHDPRGAVELYQAALEVDPDHFRAKLYLGRAAADAGEGAAAAEAVIRSYLEDAPSAGPAWVAAGQATLGRLLEAQDRRGEAEAAYRAALAADPKNEEAARRLRSLGARP